MTIQQTPINKLPYPQGADSADVPRDISALALALDPLGYVPVGSMLMWPATTAPTIADGNGNPLWLLMLGQVVLQATYPKLAVVLGAAGGNITIPDMRDRFPVGAGSSYALNATGGANTVTLTDRQSGTRAHSHGGITSAADRALGHTHGIAAQAINLAGGGGIWIRQVDNTQPWVTTTLGDNAPDHQHYIPQEAAANALDAHENRPPYRAINFIIRAG